MSLRSVVALLALALAPAAAAQDTGGLYLDAGARVGQALGKTFVMPGTAIGYAFRNGVRADVGADLVGRVRRRNGSGPGDKMERHIRLTASLVYGLPLSEQVRVDAGLQALGSLAAEVTQCGGADSCAVSEGYGGVGPVIGATAFFGRVGVRVSGGTTLNSVENVFDGAWARLALRYRP